MKPHEDWVDGSWTVDCVCGVKFDDGKEMVNCDECGVWVHTWCSRYVKGDDLFACHKCKIKNNDIQVSSAKLLVTKTLRMEDFSTQGQTVDRGGFRPCTEIPIEDRVHVQGVPGGDLALFESFSSVFTPQLWKCTGCVPKKFRFQYKEFPCWGEKENVCEIVHQEDGLLAMSKENDVTRERSGKETDDDEKLGRGCGFREMEMKDSQRVVINKDKSLVCCPLNTNKMQKESLRVSQPTVVILFIEIQFDLNIDSKQSEAPQGFTKERIESERSRESIHDRYIFS
ncbi:unnamed protein product [Arabis nemorensis]|uniref:Zinc finger PHD-type domain-containing protein n=1 Tax=Arabis nemorensis TaxID=586526 RepID=A0A565C4Y6_9BRAS|nr:unnamed protein product [Arabis nemorensis]